MRLISWLFTSAEALYYLIGFMIGIVGSLMFIGHAIHHLVVSIRPRVRPTSIDDRPVNVYIHNLNVNIEMSRQEVAELVTREPGLELPPGGERAQG